MGTWTFALGGLVVEGGVRRDVERPAPLLAHHPMPEEWRVVLVVPRAEPGLSGPAEEEAFRRLVPSPERSAEIAQLVLTSLLPALVEHDVEEFGGALTRIQQLVGDAFATVQGGRFHPRAGALVEALLREGAAGAGQSSWGPAVYGIVGGEASGRALAERMAGVVGDEGSVELVTLRQPRRARGAVMRLLVSVVDAGEAREAAAAGADIVDVKNPAEGSLGAPSPAVIAAIRAAVPAALPVSAAIGDMPNLPGTAALAALGAAHSGAAFVKVGLWGASTRGRGGRPAARGARGARPTRWWWRAPTRTLGACRTRRSRPSCCRASRAPPASTCACSTRRSRTAAGSWTGSRPTRSRRSWTRPTSWGCEVALAGALRAEDLPVVARDRRRHRRRPLGRVRATAGARGRSTRRAFAPCARRARATPRASR